MKKRTEVFTVIGEKGVKKIFLNNMCILHYEFGKEIKKNEI